MLVEIKSKVDRCSGTRDFKNCFQLHAFHAGSKFALMRASIPFVDSFATMKAMRMATVWPISLQPLLADETDDLRVTRATSHVGWRDFGTLEGA